MASRCLMHRRWLDRLVLLAIGWLVLVGSSICRADSPVHYFAERTFEIPYSMSPDRTFRRLHLHASSDGKSYSQAASTLQREGAFTYTAREDGWYYFIVQIEENDGTFAPARVNLAPPSLRVCIDTRKPRATLRAVLPRRGSVAVEWSVADENLDLQTLRLEYRPVSSQRWAPLSIRQMERAQFDWDPAGTGPFEVRLVVSDKANNRTEVTAQVRLDPSRSGAGLVGGAGAGAGAGDGNPPTGDRKVIYVPRKTFKLNYTIDRIGPSKVKHVEVWMTRDTTQWGRYQGEAPPSGPFEVTVNAQGRYGFTLRPISGVGRGPQPPRAGDLPQLWVEVDETPPVVKLHNVVVNEGADSNTITVNWQASDRFLKDTPITIFYSTTSGTDAKWELLQGDVENSGSCKCKTEGLPFEFYVRIEATDRAGNKSNDQTRDTVKVDLSEPSVIDLSVTIDNQSNKPKVPATGGTGAMPPPPMGQQPPAGNLTPTGGQSPSGAMPSPVTPAGGAGATVPVSPSTPTPTPAPTPVTPPPPSGMATLPSAPVTPPAGTVPPPAPIPPPAGTAPPPTPIPPPAGTVAPPPPPGMLPSVPGLSGAPSAVPPPPLPGM